MLKALALALVLLSWPAAAKEIAVSLTAEEWNVVGIALNELPRKLSDAVYLKIQRQVAGANNVPLPLPRPKEDESR